VVASKKWSVVLAAAEFSIVEWVDLERNCGGVEVEKVWSA